MTGEELYKIWADHLQNKWGVGVDTWEQLDVSDQDAWGHVALNVLP